MGIAPSTTGTIGVLAMQGAFREHCMVLEPLCQSVIEVRTGAQLDAVDGLVIPGGESTAIRKQLDRSDLYEPLRERLSSGMPVLGTCAGLIVLAHAPADGAPDTYGVLDIDVVRNGFGRQTMSCEAPVEIVGSALPFLTDASTVVNGVFIRAPRIARVGPEVEVIATLGTGTTSPEPVGVRQGPIIGCTFHPELAGSTVLHRFLVSMVAEVT